MAIGGDRDSWTTYAQANGLIVPSPRIRPTPPPAPRGNKYHAEPAYVDGIRFDSKKEARRFSELRALERVHAIDQLERQPEFPLHVMEVWRSQVPIRITTIGKFTADFRYRDRTSGEIVVEDTKSDATKTEAYRLRKRLAEVIHGVHVREL